MFIKNVFKYFSRKGDLTFIDTTYGSKIKTNPFKFNMITENEEKDFIGEKLSLKDK